MNGYARASHVMADVAGVVGNSNAASILPTYVRAVEQVSAEFLSKTDRPLHATVATRVIAVPDPCAANDFGRQLWLPYDLLSVTSLKVDYDLDLIYEITLVEGTDFDLWNDNHSNEPYFRIDMRPYSSILNYFPSGSRRVQIAGIWGYSYETEDTGQQVEDAAGINSSVTAITVTSAADIDPGETIVIGTEQMYISDTTSIGLTVQRAINGTTAAVHAKDTTIYRRRYPRDVEEVIKERVVGKRWDVQSGHAGAVELLGDPAAGKQNLTRGSFARWKDLIYQYRNPARFG